MGTIALAHETTFQDFSSSAGNDEALRGIVYTGNHIVTARRGITSEICSLDLEGNLIDYSSSTVVGAARDVKYNGTHIFICGINGLAAIEFDDSTGLFGAWRTIAHDGYVLAGDGYASVMAVDGNDVIVSHGPAFGSDITYLTFNGSNWVQVKEYRQGIEYSIDTSEYPSVINVGFLKNHIWFTARQDNFSVHKRLVFLKKSSPFDASIAMDFHSEGFQSDAYVVNACVHNGYLFLTFYLSSGSREYRLYDFDGVDTLTLLTSHQDDYTNDNQNWRTLVSDGEYIYANEIGGYIHVLEASPSGINVASRITEPYPGEINGLATDGAFLYLLNIDPDNDGKVRKLRIGYDLDINVTPRVGTSPLTVNFSAT